MSSARLVGSLKSRVIGRHVYRYNYHVGQKLNYFKESTNPHRRNVIIVKSIDGSVMGHVTEGPAKILYMVLEDEKIEGISGKIIGYERPAHEGTWTTGGSGFIPDKAKNSTSRISIKNDRMKAAITNADGKLPVFVFPTTLKFYIDDQNSHKQVLTLYNPYDFTILFKVLCNNPTKYSVVETEGLIKSKCCVDIVIRVIDFQQIIEREDKFRIHLYEHGLSQLLGKKDVVALLFEKSDKSEYSPKASKRYIREVDELLRQRKKESVVIQRSLPSIPVILLSLVCIISLMLPTEGDAIVNESIPKYLYLSVNQKLIAAFILGLVTMAILKP